MGRMIVPSGFSIRDWIELTRWLQEVVMAGRLVTTLVNEERSSETQEVIWQGKDSNGKQVAKGVYLYKLRTADFVETRRMVLLK